ncbi:TIGR03749 family integrating conjugative element protein [Pseudomonas aeruginosa]|uniref:TIGR03749 family integrating conjugative element protein n=1 Tax=Pseudomonas aeruginosa TaxID=287 RepID=UPI00259CEBBC|nr:TIGR03749 family integrating conjugative element protein [Pseudomonas aeruginosa]MDM5017719.1 TIGR03749 family integrating conjugative element protein [Pseudomonas aeruginosa]
MPLAVPLKVGQERIVFIDRNVRVGVPSGVGERLRVQSAGGAVYLRASEPIEPTRLQLQDADTGALILLDIAAEPAKDGEAELEPVRIVEGNSTPARYGDQPGDDNEAPARPGPGRCADRAAQELGACRADALRRAEPPTHRCAPSSRFRASCGSTCAATSTWTH